MESPAKHIDWLLALATVSVINMPAPAVTAQKKARERAEEGERERRMLLKKIKQRWLYIALYFKAESAWIGHVRRTNDCGIPGASTLIFQT